MSDYSTIQQHQPLRIPASWGAQERRFIAQLEEILDDIYRRFGRLKWADLGKALQQRFQSADGKISMLEQTAESFQVRLEQIGTPEQLINAILRIDHNGIFLLGGEVDMQTDDFTVTSLTDGEEMLHLDKQGLDAPLVSAQVIRSPSVLSVWTGGSELPFAGSISASLANLPPYLTRDVTLQIPAGVYSEDIVIAGLCGSGSLTLVLDEGAVIQGSVTISNCACPVTLDGGAILTPASEAVRVFSCADVLIFRVSMQSATDPNTGVSGICSLSSRIRVSECTFQRLGSCIYAACNSHVSAFSNQGGAATGVYTATANVGYAYRAESGAMIFVSGSSPSAYLGAANVSLNTPGPACVFGTVTETPTTGDVITPVTTLVMEASDHGRLRIATDASSSVFTSSLPFQGRSFGYDNWGAWFFSAGDVEQIYGQPIRSAKLTVTRSDAWGSDDAVEILLYTHGWSERPSTAVTFSRTSLDGMFASPALTLTLERGQTATIPLPDSVLTGLSDGTVRGFAVARQGAYAQLESSCTLTIEVGE